MTEVLNQYHGLKYSNRDPNYVYIGRGSRYGNPFTHRPSLYRDVVYVASREDAVQAYRLWVTDDTVEVPGWTKPAREEVRSLRGRKLVCFCKPEACHGDVLAELAERDDW